MGTEVTTTSGRREIASVNDPIPVLDTSRFEHMMRIASVMAAGTLVPESLVATYKGTGNNRVAEFLHPDIARANCFQVVNQAVRWGLDPFAVAQCCSIVHGKLMTEGKLIAAVIDAKLGVKLSYEWNDKVGDNFGITVRGPLGQHGENRFVIGTVGEWKTTGSNNPWGKASQQRAQLAYRGTREWCRIYEPALLLGVYTPDEMEDLQSDARSTRRVAAPSAPNRQLPALSEPKTENAPQRSSERVDDAEAEIVSTSLSDVEVDAALEALRMGMSLLKTETEIEEAYDSADLESDLTNFEGAVERARAIKEEALDRVRVEATRTAEAETGTKGAHKSRAADRKDASSTGSNVHTQDSNSLARGILDDGRDRSAGNDGTDVAFVDDGGASNDPLAIPDGFETSAEYREYIMIAGQHAVDEASAKRLSELWNGTKAMRADIPVSEPEARELQALVKRIVAKFKKPAAEPEKAIEQPAAEIDLNATPTSMEMYETLVKARTAAVTTREQAQDLKKWYLKGSDLRAELGFTKEPKRLEAMKVPMFARIAEFNPPQGA